MFSYPIIADFHADATPQAVWDAFAAVERWPQVLPGVGNARIEPPGVFETGALIRFLIGPQSAPVTQFYRVTEAEPPHRLTLESDTESWRGRTEYTIEPDVTGTHLIVRSTMEVIGPLLRLQMLVVGRTLNKQREAALRERTRALLTLAEGV
ncbi:MAG TPA: SRPBCC family protein [Pseudolabrys sp.]